MIMMCFFTSLEMAGEGEGLEKFVRVAGSFFKNSDEPHGRAQLESRGYQNEYLTFTDLKS